MSKKFILLCTLSFLSQYRIVRKNMNGKNKAQLQKGIFKLLPHEFRGE
jgi:hypothetical protein